MLGNIGAPELLVILFIALLVLGPSRLPDLANALGKSIREFRKAASDVESAVKIDSSSPPRANSAPAEPAAGQPAAPTTDGPGGPDR